MSEQSNIPAAGYMRLPAVLNVFPVGKSTWWQMVKTGRAPKPVKLSANITAWRAEDIRQLLQDAAMAKAA